MKNLHRSIEQVRTNPQIASSTSLSPQDLLNLNTELEEQNHRLNEFTSTVAHDIRGLVSSMIMHLEYVLDTDKKGLSEGTAALLQRVQQTGHRLNEMVKVSYDFARLGKEALKKNKVDLNRVIEEVVQDLCLAKEKKISVKQEDLPEVWGNQGLLARVFLNLLTNGVRYNNKTNIEFEIKLASRYVISGRNYIDIVVKDNGIGIEAEKINKIFNAYWQDIDISSSYDGLGVGLSIVHRIIELHDGTIRAESVPGAFTKFVISLPLDAN